MRGLSRATLPADTRSAGLARRHVRAACAEAGLEPLSDDAALLVTELVTNAVVHAGTALELRLDTTGPGLRVEVVDGSPGVLPTPRAADETREGGRGIFLLDALAGSWGTTHTPTGKSVWFCLGVTASGLPAVDRALPEPVELGLGDVAWLVEAGAHEGRLTAAQLVRELVHRLAEGLRCERVALLQGEPDGGGWRVVEAVGAPPSEDQVELLRRACGGRRSAVGDDLVLALGGVTGAVALIGAAGLDPARAALARLAVDRIGAVLQEEGVRASGLRDRGALALLAEASEMFAGALDVTLATTLLTQLVVPRFGDWAAVYGTTGQEPTLLAASHAVEGETGTLVVHLSSADARARVARLASRPGDHQPVLITTEELPRSLVPGLGGVLAVPLVSRRRALGLLLVARPVAARPGGADVGVLVELSRRAALAVEGARLYEERSAVAQALQASLLPPVLPEAPGLELGARYAAAGEGNEVGGDFYDVFPLPGGAWAVAIGDVCGKGAEAAAITGLARNVLRLLVEEGRPVPDAFGRLNTAILQMGERGRFLTAALAILTPYAEGLRVALWSAGHPPPALVPLVGDVRYVGAGGTLLGVTPDVEVAVERLDLRHGERLVLYTDGVTERRNGTEWFGENTLSAALQQSAGRSADAVAGHLAHRVSGFAPSAASDDLAVLVVGAVPVPVEPDEEPAAEAGPVVTVT